MPEAQVSLFSGVRRYPHLFKTHFPVFALTMSQSLIRRARINGHGCNLTKLYWLPAFAVLAGCTNLPIDGPSNRAITTGATASLVSDRHKIVFDYALVEINEQVLNALPRDLGPGSFLRTFGDRQQAAPAIKVGEGDVIQLTVFESAAGGLFIPTEAGVRPGNFVTLPAQTVGRSGTISVPYAGPVRALGRTTEQIKTEIEEKLAKRAVEPQAVVTLGEQTGTSVSILGDGIAAKFQIRPHERVLDIIARAGGLKYPGYETFVVLQRKGRNSTVYFPALIHDPRENIYVRAGDTIYVHREQQKFVAVGALGAGGQTAGVTGLFSFEQEKLTLNEAMAKAGGLLDSRASASDVFIYRMEARETLERMGVETSKFNADHKFVPTVYRANYRDPSVFFFTQQFSIRNKDAIYVANADSVELEKFLFHTRAVSATIGGTLSDIRLGRDAARAIGQ